MAQHNVTISGLSAVANGLRALGADLPAIVDKSLENSAIQLYRVCRDEARTVTAEYNGRIYKAYDTGRLANGITYRKDGLCKWIVAATEEYSIYVEFGTGSAGDPAVAHTTRPKWVYFSDKAGDYRTAYPQPARPFMRPAFAKMRDVVLENTKHDIIAAYDKATR